MKMRQGFILFFVLIVLTSVYALEDCGLRVNYDGEPHKIACDGESDLGLKVMANGVIYNVALVETTDSTASKLRVNTATGTKAIAEYIPNPEGLLLHYDFNTANMAVDISGNGMDGVTQGAVNWNPDGYVEFNYNGYSGSPVDPNYFDTGLVSNGQIKTMSAWFNFKQFCEGGRDQLIGVRQGPYFGYWCSNDINFRWGQGSSGDTIKISALDPPGTVKLNQWQMFTTTVEDIGGGLYNIHAYVDGLPVRDLFIEGFHGNSGSLTANGQNFWVGVTNNNGVPYGQLDAFFDNLRIYDRQLSQSEIEDIYNLEKPPTVSLSGPGVVDTNEWFTLTWTSTNADSCTKSWMSGTSTSGSDNEKINPAGTNSYTVTCTNAGSSISVSDTVSVTATTAVVPAPTASLIASPYQIPLNDLWVGDEATLTWSSTNANTCTASGAWSGTKAISGSQRVTKSSEGTYTYIITCTNIAGDSVSRQTSLAYSSSCPLLFYQDGEEFKYATDISSGVLGLYDDKFAKHYDRSNMIVPVKPNADNEYVFKIREPMDEIAYVDDAKLLLIDHPKDIEIVHTGVRSAVGKPYEYKIYTVSDIKQPVKVIDMYGTDVTSLMLDVDNKGPEVNLYEDDYYDIYLDDIEGNENAKLILDLWTYMSSKEEQINHPFEGNVYPYIEVINSEGKWQKVLGWPYSTADFKSITIELGEIFLTNDHTIRLHTGKYHPLSETVIDRIRYDESDPVPYTITEVLPNYAELEYDGGLSFIEQNLNSRMIAQDDVIELGNIPYYGAYTKFGDVLPLLEEQDDMFVVMRKGDTVDLKFSDVEFVDDLKRTVIFSSKTWFKVDKSQDNSNEEPGQLPFTGMTAYPYDTSVENYPQDEEHQNYLKEWNTRVIVKE